MRGYFVASIAIGFVVLAYACGDSGSDTAFDAGIPDAGRPEELPDTYRRPTIDADIDSAPLPVVTVQFTDVDGKPLSGQNAYFYPGSVTAPSIVTSNANGNASLVMSSGSVTVVVSTRFGNELMTVLALEGGDTIHVTPLPNADLSYGATLSGSIAAPTTIDAGALRFAEDPGCPSNTAAQTPNDAGTYAFDITRACIPQTGSIPVLFEAMAVADNSIVAVAPKQIAVTIDAGVTTNVAAGDWIATTQKSATITGALPAWATSVSEVVDSTQKQADFASTQTTTPPLVYPALPSTFASNVDFDVTLAGTSGAIQFQSEHVQRVAATGSLTDDVTTFLPQLLTATTSGVANAPTIAWTLGAPLSTDAIGSLVLAGPPGDASEPPFWFVAFPVTPTTTSVTLPPLPTALQIYGATSWTPELSLITTTSTTYANAHLYPGGIVATPETLFDALGVATFDAKITSNMR